MKKFCKYIIFIVLCVNCTESRNIFNTTEQVFDGFEREFWLQAKPIHFDSIAAWPVQIYHFDSLLLFEHRSRSASPHFFSIYNLQTNKFIGSFLQRGRGPNEFIELFFYDEHTLQDNDRWLYLTAANEKKIIKFNLSNFLQTGAIDVKLLHEYKGLQMTTHILNDSTFFAWMFTRSREGMRVFYRKYFSTSDKLEEINLTKRDIKDEDEFDILWATERIRQDKKKMVMAMHGMNKIHIFDLEEPKNNITLTPKNQKYESLSDLARLEPLQRITYYNGVTSTQDYIFALFLNQLVFDRHHGQSKGVEIHIFDWNGRPLYKLHVEEHLFGFCIDPIKKIMYAYDSDENIYQYDLSEIL